MIVIFLLQFFHRSLSGAQNGSGYSGSHRLMLLFTSLLVVIPVGWAIANLKYYLDHPVIGASIIAAAVASILLHVMLQKVQYKHVHSLENLNTAFFFAGIVLFDPVMAMLGMYPGLVCFNVFKNLLIGLPWNSNKTDDPDGSHYGINVPGFLVGRKVFKWIMPEIVWIPRTSFKVRLTLAIVCLVAAVGLMVWNEVR
jgi:hypothetical protein